MLPLKDSASVVSQQHLHVLLNDCILIVSESRTVSGSFNSDHFSSSFRPSDYRILGTVEQTLPPGVSTLLENQLRFRRTSAELYKLNVSVDF